MIKYYCDYCKKEIPIDTTTTRIYVGDIYSDENENSYNKHLYLCLKCKFKFKKLIRRIARKYGAK